MNYLSWDQQTFLDLKIQMKICWREKLFFRETFKAI